MSEQHVGLDDLRQAWEEAAHSIFGPSSSAMYLICSGSLIPHLLAKDETSYEAAEGTVAHSVADIWLRTGQRPDHLVGVLQEQDGFWIEITEVMLGYVEKYVDWCMNLVGVDHYFETRTDISSLTPIPGQFGTADHFALAFGHMTITDLKYGEGVKVWAADDKSDPRVFIGDLETFELNGNSQACLYALGVFFEWDWFYHFEKITIRICQPRLDHFDVWETTREELLRFAEWATERMKLAWRHGAPRTPSKKGCRWCRVEKNCAALLAWTEQFTGSKFENLDEPQKSFTQGDMLEAVETISDPTVVAFDPVDPANLSIEQLANIYRYRGLIEGWFKKIEKLLKDTLDGDNEIEVPYWKIVEGISRRKFADQKAAEDYLEMCGLDLEEIWVKKLVSPNQAEELLQTKKKLSKRQAALLIEDLVIKPPGPRTLAQINDNRNELPPDGDRFDDLDADDV